MALYSGPPVKSLNAVTTTGAGTVYFAPMPIGTFALQTVVTGTPASVSCTLEVSLDGSDWMVVATSTSTTGDSQYATGKPASFFRANLGTLTGGTVPTVTAYIGAGRA